MNECTLRVHLVVFLGNSLSEDAAHSNIVTNHRDILLSRNHHVAINLSGRHFVQTDLESGWAPFNERDLVVLLQPLNSSVSLLRFDVPTVVNRDGHVLILNGIEVSVFDEHVLGLQYVIGNLTDGLSLMRSLVLADDRCKCGGHEVKSREGYQVGLELAEIDIQLTIESKGRCHGRNNLRDDYVQIRVARTINVQLFLTNHVEGFIVEDDGHLSVIKQPVSRQHRVIRFHNASRDFRCGINLESNLGFLAVVDSDTFKDKSTKSGSGTTSNGMMNDEPLHVLRVIHKLPQAVIYLIKNFFSHSVVTTGKVVGSVFLAVDKELRVEHLGIISSSNIIDNSRFKIDCNVPWHELSSSSLLEESREIQV